MADVKGGLVSLEDIQRMTAYLDMLNDIELKQQQDQKIKRKGGRY